METSIGNSLLTSDLPEDLKEVFGIILKLIVPEKIFLLGARENEQDKRLVYNLLIIITNDAGRPYNEYKAIMEHAGRRIWPVTCTIIKAHDFFKKLAEGNIYFSRVCRSENLLYDNGIHPLPAPEMIPVQDIIAKSAKDFNDGWRRAASFLEGACYYADKREKEPAAFMLHQAAELTFRAIIKSLTDHEVFSHDLRSLRQECRFCAPGMATVFPFNNEEERRLLHLLQKAYVHTRYSDQYEISEHDLTVLLERVTRLHAASLNIFSVKIKEAEEALSRL